MAGLDEFGLTIKRLQEIVEELADDVQANFGADGVTVMTHAESGFGRLIGIFSKPVAEIWELYAAVYASQWAGTSKGVGLDNVLALSNLRRLAATKTTIWQALVLDAGAVVPSGSLVAHDATDDKFRTTADVTGDGDSVVGCSIVVSGTVIGASFVATIDGAVRDILAGTYSTDTDVAAALAAEIDRTDLDISAVDQAGRKFTIEPTGDHRSYFAIGKRCRVVGGGSNTGVYTVSALAFTGGQTIVSVVESIPSASVLGQLHGHVAASSSGATVTLESANQLPAGAGDLSAHAFSVALSATGGGSLELDSVTVPHLVEALESGPIDAAAGTVNVIATPVSGWTSTTNKLSADVGNFVESDPDARLRRAKSLAVKRVESVLRGLSGVDSVRVYFNDDGAPDAEGRPGHSIEAVVTGGSDTEIAETIWATKAGGIQTYGNTAVPIVDSEGEVRVVKFSRPADILIYVKIEVASLYDEEDLPANPAGAIQEAVVTYGDTLAEGVNVIAKRIEASVALAVPGLENFTAKIGTAANPTTSTTIGIASNQRARFDATRVTVTGV